MTQRIDLAFAGTAPDGALIYASPLVAAVGLIHRETLEPNFTQEFLEATGFTLRLAGVVGAMLYFAGPHGFLDARAPITSAWIRSD